MRSRPPRRRPTIVWVPVGTNVALVALAAVANDHVAVALTAIGAVVGTGAVLMHLRDSDQDKERIAHLQATIPNLTAPLDAQAAVNLAPKPSAVVTEVLRQQQAAVLEGSAVPGNDAVTSISLAPVLPIDRT